MSLRLDRFAPISQTKQETAGIERRPRLWREKRSGNRPLCYMIVRQKPEQVFVFRVLYAVNLYFHLLTRN